MAVIPEPERTQLYTRIRHLLGAPLRSVELEDEQLDSLLQLAIDDYSQYILDWLIFINTKSNKVLIFENKPIKNHNQYVFNESSLIHEIE